MTDAEIAELRAGLEHCTPGPWVLEIETSEHVDESDEDRQPEVYVCSPATVCDYTVVATMGRAEAIRHDRKSRDAAHITRCSPDKIAALLARLDAAESGWPDEAKIKAARERAEALGPGMPGVMRTAFGDIAENAIRQYFRPIPKAGG